MINASTQTTQISIKSIIDSASITAKKYWGHVWSYIEKVPTYTQSPYVAYPALVAATCVAYEVAKISVSSFQYFFPIPEVSLETIDDESLFTKKRVVELSSSLLGFGIIGGCLTLFVEGTKLPLKTPVVVGVSVATLAVRLLIEKYYQDKTSDQVE